MGAFPRRFTAQPREAVAHLFQCQKHGNGPDRLGAAMRLGRQSQARRHLAQTSVGANQGQTATGAPSVKQGGADPPMWPVIC